MKFIAIRKARSIVKAASPLLIVVLATLTAASVHSGVVELPPSSNSVSVAANEPNQGNVYAGVGQSFVAEDPRIIFGFYVVPFDDLAASPYMFSLFAGDGEFATPLAQVIKTITQPLGSPELVEVDFSSVALIPGATYTALISLPDRALPTEGASTALNVILHSTNNAYTDGRFHYLDSSFDPDLSFIVNRDLALRITPTTEAEAVPATLNIILIKAAIDAKKGPQ